MDDFYFDTLDEPVKQFLSHIPPVLLGQAVYVRFAPNALVVRKGTTVDYVYALMGGDVAVLNEFSDGNSYVFASVGQCRFISTLEVLAQQPIYAASLICTGETAALRIPAERFRQVLDHDPTFLRIIVTDLARSMYVSSSSQGKNFYRPARERVAAYLLKYCLSSKTTARDIRVTRTRQVIANNIGVSLKTVNRALFALREEDFLSIVHGRIYISPAQRGRLERSFSLGE